MYGQIPLIQPNFNAFGAQREEAASRGMAPNLTDQNLGELMGPVAGRGGLHVQFFYMNVLIESADPTLNGTFQPRLCIAKMPKGDRLTVATRFISEEQAMREFPREFTMFKTSDEVPTDGTPLRELPGIAQSQLAMLMLYQLRSIEDLASVPQEQVNGMGLEIITAHKLAKAWLRNKTENADMIAEAKNQSQIDAQLEQMRRQLEALQKQNIELDAQNKALTAVHQALGTAPVQQQQPYQGVQYAPVAPVVRMPAEVADDELPDSGMFAGGMVDDPNDLNQSDPLGLLNEA